MCKCSSQSNILPGCTNKLMSTAPGTPTHALCNLFCSVPAAWGMCLLFRSWLHTERYNTFRCCIYNITLGYTKPLHWSDHYPWESNRLDSGNVILSWFYHLMYILFNLDNCIMECRCKTPTVNVRTFACWLPRGPCAKTKQTMPSSMDVNLGHVPFTA